MRTFILFLFAVVSTMVFATNIDSTKQQVRKKMSTLEIVRKLSSDEFEGRYPGTVGMEKAITFIETYFQKNKIKPFFANSYKDTVLVGDRISYNLVGIIPSTTKSADYILIGAHIDHLGKSNAVNGDSICNGANDNASGVTAVLQMIPKLKKHKFNKNIIIAIFTEEEAGLIGSEHLAKKLKLQNIPLSYVMNFEMIGTPLSTDKSQVYITGIATSDFANKANEAVGKTFIELDRTSMSQRLFSSSDNYSFYEEYTIPSHTISTFTFDNYAYYHSPKDEYTQLDIPHMDYVIKECTNMIIKLLEQQVTISLTNLK